MNFDQRCTIPVDRERLWDFFMDVPAVGECVPGVTKIQRVAENRYQGALSVKLGLVNLSFDVQVTLDLQEKGGWRAAMRAEANDRWVGGSVKAAFKMQLQEGMSGATDLVIGTELNVLGRLGQFGQPLIRKKADSILEEFAANVQRRFSSA